MLSLEETRHLHIVFSSEPVENKKKSDEAGRPIYEDREMVEIKFVGDPKKVLVAPAHDKFMRDPSSGEWVSYAQAYARHYEAFKAGEIARGGDGTPLEELPFLTSARRAELKALNIYTAEGLAGLEGPALSRLGMYGRELKNKAQAYIDHAKDTAVETRLTAENDALKERMAALEAMLAEQQQAPRRGRPPKAEQHEAA